MKRERKFRVWDVVGKKMWTPEMDYKGFGSGAKFLCIDLHGRTSFDSPYGFSASESLEARVLMDYTGIFDCEGKEICEGDKIGVFGGTETAEVRYIVPHGCWGLINSGYNSMYKDSDGKVFNYKRFTQASVIQFQWKVVGNIYED